jgi:serine/threonine protein kinase
MKQFLESKYTSKSTKASKDGKEAAGGSASSSSSGSTVSSSKAELDEKRRALEQQLDQMAVQETERVRFREVFAKAEADAQKDQRKRLSTDDFEPLALIGRGAYGEVRLVRMRERFSRDIYAMKSIPKEAMIIKNQVTHVRAERDILTQAAESNPWIVVLYYTFQVLSVIYPFASGALQGSITCITVLLCIDDIFTVHMIYPFQDERNLYMVMEYIPGGDLMGLLMREDVLTEAATKQYMAELVLAIASVHELGYIHRDLKPDNVSQDSLSK